MANSSGEARLLFVIRSLHIGGAERQLSVLARALKERGCDVHVAVFYGGGPLEVPLRNAGVVIHGLDKKSKWSLVGPMMKLRALCAELHPSFLIAYLGLANIFSALVKMTMPSQPVVWTVRASNMDLTKYRRASRISYAIERRLSRYADLVIANSHAGRAYAVSKGFPEDRIHVVSNGIDTEQFRADALKRAQTRQLWGISSSEFLVGMVARFDPMKDFETFLRAAAVVRRRREDVRFVCVSTGGLPEYAASLRRMATELLPEGAMLWVTGDSDASRAYNAFDLLCSCSTTEGFSNVIGEAMACEVPAVVTPAGDSAEIVGDTGVVVPFRDHDALASAILSYVGRVHDGASGRLARKRIEERFSVSNLVDNTRAVLAARLGKAAVSMRGAR